MSAQVEDAAAAWFGGRGGEETAVTGDSDLTGVGKSFRKAVRPSGYGVQLQEPKQSRVLVSFGLLAGDQHPSRCYPREVQNWIIQIRQPAFSVSGVGDAIDFPGGATLGYGTAGVGDLLAVR